jgi:hypothetical protein
MDDEREEEVGMSVGRGRRMRDGPTAADDEDEANIPRLLAKLLVPLRSSFAAALMRGASADAGVR